MYTRPFDKAQLEEIVDFLNDSKLIPKNSGAHIWKANTFSDCVCIQREDKVEAKSEAVSSNEVIQKFWGSLIIYKDWRNFPYYKVREPKVLNDLLRIARQKKSVAEFSLS